MLVSMTRDGAPHPHAGRDGDDAGAMSDGGLIEGVIPSSARAGGFSSKPASLSFAPTPMLVHHSALRLKDIQASSSGKKIQNAAADRGGWGQKGTERTNKRNEEKILAKALDGQRYPCPA